MRLLYINLCTRIPSSNQLNRCELLPPLPSGLHSHHVMELAVADVLAERVHDAPRVVMRALDVHGHPVPAELQVAHAVPLAEMSHGLREVRVRLEPEPASVPDRAEHDPLDEHQRHLYGYPRITAEGISIN